MKLPELKEKLKSKYIVRVVAGVLTIALVGTGIGATAVFAEKNSTAVTAEADSTTDSSKDADDIADKLMDSVSLKDNDADKDESVYLISDANGNVNKTIVVDHLKNKDKKDTLEDASNLSDIENVKGKEKFTKANGTMGAGAVNKYVKKKFKIRVMFMTSTKIICEVIDGFKDKYSEEKTEPTDKIEEKEVVEF